MKNILTKSLQLILIFLFFSCSDNNIVNNGGGNGNLDFDLFLGKINSQLRRVESYTIKKDGTGLSLFNDSMVVTSCSYNSKITLAKLDSVSGFYYSGLYTADVNGSNIKKIPSAGYFPQYYIISNTGDKVLFTTDAGNYMCVINSDGTGFIQLSDGIRGTEIAPKFSPDGTRIAYFEAPASLETSLYIINTSGQNKKLLADSIFYDIGNTSIDWSPDGSRIIFQNKINNGTVTKICDIDTSGNGYVELATGSMPAWSPSGDKIFYQVNVNQGIEDIFMMNPDGSQQVNLTSSPDNYDRGLMWSKDGTRILYISQQVQSQQTRVMFYDKVNGSSSFVADSFTWGVWKY